MAEVLAVIAIFKALNDVVGIAKTASSLLRGGVTKEFETIQSIQKAIERVVHKDLMAASLALEQATMMNTPQLLVPKLQLAAEESLRALGVVEEFEHKLFACRIHCFSLFAHAAAVAHVDGLCEAACLRDAKLAAHVALRRLVEDSSCTRLLATLRPRSSANAMVDGLRRFAVSLGSIGCAAAKGPTPEALAAELAQLSWAVWHMPPLDVNNTHPSVTYTAEEHSSKASDAVESACQDHQLYCWQLPEALLSSTCRICPAGDSSLRVLKLCYITSCVDEHMPLIAGLCEHQQVDMMDLNVCGDLSAVTALLAGTSNLRGLACGVAPTVPKAAGGSGNHALIPEHVIANLGEHIQACPSLEILELPGHNLGEGGLQTFLHAAGGCKLRRLSLARNSLGQQGARILTYGFHSLQHLEELDLSENMLGNEGTCVIANSLGNSDGIQFAPYGLRWLCLANNRIESIATQSFVAAIPHVSTMFCLVLSGNPGLLLNNSAQSSPKECGSSVALESVLALIHCADRCGKLRTLWLDGCAHPDSMVFKDLADAVASLTLPLSSCEFLEVRLHPPSELFPGCHGNALASMWGFDSPTPSAEAVRVHFPNYCVAASSRPGVSAIAGAAVAAAAARGRLASSTAKDFACAPVSAFRKTAGHARSKSVGYVTRSRTKRLDASPTAV